MARPGAVQQVEQELGKAHADVESQGRKLSELKKSHGDIKDAEKRLAELGKVMEGLCEDVASLESKKESLTAWVNTFRDTKTKELEREFNGVRNELVVEITRLTDIKNRESEAISDITEAREANDRRLIRQMKSAIRQNTALEAKKTIIRNDIDRCNREASGNAQVRSVLVSRIAKLEERERRFDIKSHEYDEAMNSTITAKKQADGRKAALESTALDLQQQQTEVQESRNALKAEMFAARNETTRLKAALSPLQDKLSALTANIGALERRERVCDDRERRLKLKGVDLGS